MGVAVKSISKVEYGGTSAPPTSSYIYIYILLSLNNDVSSPNQIKSGQFLFKRVPSVSAMKNRRATMI